MSTGALLQLAARGPQDAYLCSNSEITFFKTIYKRHTNFAIETINDIFINKVDFDEKLKYTVQRKGDLISNIYLKINLNRLEQSCNNINYYWTNAIGHVLIEYIELRIGGLLIDKHYGEWLEVWGELTQNEEKRTGYFEMIGKITDGLSTINKEKFKGPLQLYVPLNFWFCKNIGLALPLISLQYHDIDIYIKIRPFDECYISTDGSKIDNNNNYLNMDILIDYIYLDIDERKKMAQLSHEYLIEQTQLQKCNIEPCNSISVPINFNHPIKEFIWIFRRTDVNEFKIDPCNSNNIISYGNDWFNFSSIIGNIHGFDDIFDKCTLYLNGGPRFLQQSADFFRLLQPYMKHTRIPSKQIYIYSFAIRPEEYQPTGTCNYSRIDNSTFKFTFKTITSPINYTLFIFAINYNVLRIKNGSAELAYIN